MKSNLEKQILKPSKFSSIYKNGRNIAIFHSKLIEAVYINQEAYKIFSLFTGGQNVGNIISQNPKSKKQVKNLISKLIDSKLLVSVKNNETEFINKLKQKGEVDIRLMYFFPTDKCNFNCKYCFIESAFPKNHNFTFMEKETAKKGLDFFFKVSNETSKNKRRIIFYGGEPLLNKKILEYSIKYARNHQSSENTDLHLITNGSLITDNFAKILKENEIYVSLSLDGLEQINDKARVYLNRKGTYKDVKKGYQILKNANINNIGISYTIGSHNVENLTENVQDLLKEFDIKGIGFNFITDFPQGKNPLSTDIGFATEKAMEAFELLRKKGIYEERIMRKLKPFVEREIHLKDCAAIGNQIVLAPNGDIGPCHAFINTKEFFTHNIYEKNINLNEDPVYKEWSRRMPVNMKECNECPAIGICGGGCPYQAKITKGSIWRLDERMCEHNKKFLEWAIWDAYRQDVSKD